MTTNRNLNISIEVFKTTITRLTNQLWKVLPMFENNEDWQKQLDTVIIDVAGLSEIFIAVPQYLQLLIRLEGLKVKATEIDFPIFRKTIFESINLLQEASKCAQQD